MQQTLPGLMPPAADVLRAHHYLGPGRGDVYQDAAGVIVVRRGPTSRRLPVAWLELVRWCIVDGARNAGSRQWAHAVRWMRRRWPDATTVVSYSDPSAGHTGALYRACNWLWAPTWHRLVPPPTGSGAWTAGTPQSAKDRWVFPLARDAQRAPALALDASYERRFPGAGYREPRWRRGRPTGGGGDWRTHRRRVDAPGRVG